MSENNENPAPINSQESERSKTIPNKAPVKAPFNPAAIYPEPKVSTLEEPKTTSSDLDPQASVTTKRPLGVFILAILFLAYTLLFLLSSATIATLPIFGKFISSINLVFAAVSLIIAVGLLRLNEFARVVTICIIVVSMVFSGLSLYQSIDLKNKYDKSFDVSTRVAIERYTNESSELKDDMAIDVFKKSAEEGKKIVHSGIYRNMLKISLNIALSIWVLVYLTRPKVKENFS